MNNYIGVQPLETHFNSNCTFIALNLSYSKGTLKAQQNSEPISVSRDRKKGQAPQRKPGGE